jgi:hypothetical protein
MKPEDLKEKKVYRYAGSAENVNVMYMGSTFVTTHGWRYGFRGYNEETGKYDGYYATLGDQAVKHQVSEV